MNAAGMPPEQGLSEARAAELLQMHGANILHKPQTRSLPQVAAGALKEPMFLLLLVAAGLYLAFGDLAEGLFLCAGALVSVGLVVFQEARSERALAALNALAEPSARVMRDGEARDIPARNLVPGDLLLVGEGQRLPADAWLVAGDPLTVEEAALTGEAAPVTKQPAAPRDDDPAPGDENTPALFAGTMIVRGQGRALVTRTGAATRLGRIGASLGGITEEPTLLQRSVGRLIGRLGLLAIGFCGVVAVAYGLLRGDWLEGALAGLTLAIALLPEEFPMVLAVFMALGAWRLARHQVLVRRSAVVETLGATTLLCVDKTGTLTENRMRVTAVWRGGLYPLDDGPDDAALPVLRAARLASAVGAVDPMDMAVHAAAPAPAGVRLLRSYPLRPDFLAFVQVWETGAGVTYAAKGAPEMVLRLCRLEGDAAEAARAAVEQLAASGMRVLGVAEARMAADGSADPAMLPFELLGLLAFVDPVRDDVPAALAEARTAGIGVAMITGDYPATALAIARDAGIDTANGAMTGAEVAATAPERLAERIREVRVFARVMPEQKLALVEAFKAGGHVVAMTGDGVNDAPALAAANIGIAMGRRGTDVAREAADIVLLDDRFASIVGGVRLGRRIFANLRKALTYIVAIHVPIAGLALLPLLLGLPPLLFPMHVVLLELLIDPLCSLVFEGERSEADAMRRPPRPARESLFGRRQLLHGIAQGALLLVVTLVLYGWRLADGAGADAARTSAFVALVTGNLALALADAAGGRSALLDPRRVVFWGIGGVATLVLAAALYVPAFAALLKLVPPSPMQLLVALGAGLGAGATWMLIGRRGSRPAPA